ncbi:beta-ketoacyl-[acyl-carrier-protein] synthase family protein [Verminephrobacter aporrectodeae subsp. tuberculatae]|uniref:beta-ketoacyl-[acyl-carrier-protein] synthase family protein n=1 Tax=Verminephrobacter aporrectodeae TaxID=1110389 RepID=UPI00023781E5|nr:beta-ketoacyl-[acyl-carrier-protein] synthase family protein [Verminephrobacter aporrectodeae]MCW5257149.1 beta-ketoacyl-[acyl-carrier-protein] synthase family protein [Verminephrobacter aporrectodeae subsp. tuberculatae]MCW8163579.1 beta-ketoacyl-[acyl-carrier-protein] synthase family protein [Verminephrobacter aporrectodeae subsp. tuberculatae]MCW8167700.1 beta-ketoacyl-[acyl-carrier-protein] synthase family protein [Verminephrobacter aporrectodeae subsp. tuberculatae]
MNRVVVTGYGAVTALGETADDSWNSILNKSFGYRMVDDPGPNIRARCFAFLPDRRGRYTWIPKAILRCLSPFARNAVVAARESLAHAFGDPAAMAEHYAPHERAIIIGTGWGGVDASNSIHADYRDTGLGDAFGSLTTMPSVATGACSILWQMRGYQNTVNAACATGTIAIGDAFELIRSGRARVALAGGSESLKDSTNVWNIDVLSALSKETSDVHRACCPFDRRRSGFVLAEGAAVLCLEELESAVRRGAKILGEVTGYGNFSDASDFTAPSEDMAARILSIETALKQAGRRARDIQYINAHGTSTPLNDLNETNAIKAALGTAAFGIPISSTKSYSGHLISAAGSFETIVCLKAIESGIIPATANLHEPDQNCDLDYVPNEHRHAQSLSVALNLSFGFGGANAALVVERLR